jgi:hypothetical protein
MIRRAAPDGHGVLLAEVPHPRLAGTTRARARVGYLPELFRYQPWLTAAEVLALHVKLTYDVPALRRTRGCEAQPRFPRLRTPVQPRTHPATAVHKPDRSCLTGGMPGVVAGRRSGRWVGSRLGPGGLAFVPDRLSAGAWLV